MDFGQMEARVWERLAASQPGREAPGELLREAEALAREYRALPDREGIGRLRREQQEITRILAGIRVLGQEGGSKQVQRLRRCYHLARSAMIRYAALAAVPETGLAYQHLSEQARQQCITLLLLLGSGGM